MSHMMESTIEEVIRGYAGITEDVLFNKVVNILGSPSCPLNLFDYQMARENLAGNIEEREELRVVCNYPKSHKLIGLYWRDD